MKLHENVYPVTAVVVISVIFFIFFRYAMLDSYLEHAGPAVAARAWRLVAGGAVYPGGEAENYQLVGYGPVLFLLHGFWLWLLGGTFLATKVSGMVSVGLALGLIAHHASGQFGPRFTAFAVTLFGAGLLYAVPYAIWSRPEPELVALVAAAVVLGARDRQGAISRWLVPVGVGVCMGLAAGLKLHAPLYFIPVLAPFLGRTWFRDGLLLGTAAVLALVAPFLHPQVSLTGWLAGFAGLAAERGGYEWHLIGKVATHGAALLLAPLALLPWAWRAASWPTLTKVGLYVVGLGVAGVLAVHPGAGWYYLIPFLPVAIDICLDLLRLARGKPRVAALAMPLLVVLFIALAVAPTRRLIKDLGKFAAETPARELVAIMAAHPGRSIEMGVGARIDSYRTTHVGSLLAFAGHPATTASWSAMESVFLGQAPPAALLARLERCATDLWLIPKGEAPFAMPNYYPGGKTTYWPEFRSAFVSRYELRQPGRTFDVWGCKGT